MAAVLVPLSFSLAEATWPTDPTVNLAVCARAQIQANPVAISDGGGGVIVAWQDARNQSNDIYAQRIAADGSILWAPVGIPVCAATGEQVFPKIVPDGQGGAIIVWEDRRLGTPDVFAQRIDAAGVAQWVADGVVVSQGSWTKDRIRSIADGLGGAIACWIDGRNGLPDIYAQRIDAAGDTLWTLNGVGVCTDKDDQVDPELTSDGSGGALVAWVDGRDVGRGVYMQRIGAGGAPVWTLNGTAITDTSVNQDQHRLVPDGAGGAIITWADQRHGPIAVYAQRVVDALRPWGPNGVPVCTVPEGSDTPRPIGDGSGGVIVAWYDYRAGNADIYAQRVSGGGVIQWPANGVVVCADAGEQIWPSIGGDGFGGAIIAWADYRHTASRPDIYARRIDGSGTAFWSTDGNAISTAEETQFSPVVVADGMGGSILTWQDQRGDTGDIYAQHIGSNGRLGDLVAVVIDAFDAHPTHGGVVLTWEVFADEPVAGFRIYRRDAGAIGGMETTAATVSPAHRRYVDHAVRKGGVYLYTLAVVLPGGGETRSRTVAATIPTVDVTLEQNVPNPFNPGTTIGFVLPRPGAATLAIYNTEGRRVRTLIDGLLPRGPGESYWDGRDESGNPASSGIYFSRLSFGKTILTRKMLLLK
jgi:hypothetical protein